MEKTSRTQQMKRQEEEKQRVIVYDGHAEATPLQVFNLRFS